VKKSVATIPPRLQATYLTVSTVLAFLCRYPGCNKSFTVASNMRRHERTHDFSAFVPWEGDENSDKEGDLHGPSSTAHSVSVGSTYYRRLDTQALVDEPEETGGKTSSSKAYHSSVAQEGSQPALSQSRSSPAEQTVFTQQEPMSASMTAAEVYTSARNAAHDTPRLNYPILAFLTNASLSADVIESLTSSVVICAQQSLELSAKSCALVETLNDWAQRPATDGPSAQDFGAARDLKRQDETC
jgi:hypothetical protein